MVLGEYFTDIVATNTSGHYHIRVLRPHRDEWINWGKPASAVNSQAIMAAASSSLATLPKPRPYSNRSVKRLSLLIRRGRQSRCKRRKNKMGWGILILNPLASSYARNSAIP